jgi:hypothetical protein
MPAETLEDMRDLVNQDMRQQAWCPSSRAHFLDSIIEYLDVEAFVWKSERQRAGMRIPRGSVSEADPNGSGWACPLVVAPVQPHADLCKDSGSDCLGQIYSRIDLCLHTDRYRWHSRFPDLARLGGALLGQGCHCDQRSEVHLSRPFRRGKRSQGGKTTMDVQDFYWRP